VLVVPQGVELAAGLRPAAYVARVVVEVVAASLGGCQDIVDAWMYHDLGDARAVPSCSGEPERVADGDAQGADLVATAALGRYAIRGARRSAGSQRCDEEPGAAAAAVERIGDGKGRGATAAGVPDLELDTTLDAHLQAVAHVAIGPDMRVAGACPRDGAGEQDPALGGEQSEGGETEGSSSRIEPYDRTEQRPPAPCGHSVPHPLRDVGTGTVSRTPSTMLDGVAPRICASGERISLCSSTEWARALTSSGTA